MNEVIIGCIGLLVFIAIMLLGVPIPFSMLIVGVVGFATFTSPTAAAQLMVTEFQANFSSYTLTVAPMFGLMGFLASNSNVGKSLIQAENSYLGHRKGGQAMAVQVACAGFGAICGSIPASIGTMSSIVYPEMRNRGYSPVLAGPAIASGANLAALIPPSLLFIIYGVTTETSIGGLFLAGIIPGILLTVLNFGAVWLALKRHPDYAKVSPKASWKERLRLSRSGGIPIIAIIFIISMGGMFTGFFTPTEAGAVGACSMLVITAVTKQLNMKKLIDALLDTVRLQAMTFMLLTCATIFGRFLSVSRLPTTLGNLVVALDVPAWMVMSLIIILFLILGCFIDLVSMIVITMPIFFPIVVKQLGYDPFWFGVIMVVLISVGSITPPFGGNIFLLKGCIGWDEEATVSKLFRGVLPFCLATVASIVIMLIFPEIVSFLPHLVYG